MDNQRKKRVDALLEQGLKKQVVLIEAAPGHGKSELAQQYLKEKSIDYSWLRLRQMDNWLFFNWKQLIKSLVKIMPTAHKFLQLEVPTTVGQIAELIELIEQFGNKKRVLVIDDYSILQNKHLRFLYESLIEANFSSLSLIIISSRKTNLSTVCNRSNVDFFYISDQDLRFTSQETNQLFMENQYELSYEQVNKINDRWHGWPLPLKTIAKDSFSLEQILSNPLKPIDELFYTQFYENFSQRIRTTLVQLSLLDKIPREIFTALDLSTDEIEVMDHNPFIFQELESNSIVFHHAYYDFLKERQQLLTEEERINVFKSGAEIFSQRDQLEDALPLCIRSKEYGLAITLIWKMISLFTDYSKACFLDHYVTQIPNDYFALRPTAELLRIYVLCLLNEVEKVETSLNKLIARIENMEEPDTETLGEAHFLLSQFARLTGNENYMEHLQLASHYLPNGSRYFGEPIPVIIRASWVRFPRYLKEETNQLERAKQILKESNPYYTKIYRGKNVQLDKFGAAEIDYYHYDLEEARVKFLEMLHLNEMEQTHEAQLLTRHYLLRIALLQGNVAEARRQAKAVEQLIQKQQLYQYNGFHARLLGLISLYLDDLAAMPTRIINNSIDQAAKWSVTRNGLTQSRYMVQKHEYGDAIALLNYLEQAYQSYEGHWMNTAYIRILRGIAYSKYGDNKAAIKDMLAAYEMTYGNHVVTPFIEFGGDTRYLIQLIQEEYPGRLDQEWVDFVITKTNSFSRRVRQLRKQKTSEASTIQLTTRRKEILKDLVEGLSVNEIAEKRNISRNTVKTHIKNIYSDLGAMNRSDAVRIAIKRGIV